MHLDESPEIVLALGDLLHDLEQFCINMFNYTPDLNEVMDVIIVEGVGCPTTYKDLRMNISTLTQYIFPENMSLTSDEIYQLHNILLNIVDEIKDSFEFYHPFFNNFETKGYMFCSSVLLDQGTIMDQNTGVNRRTHMLSVSLHKLPY